MPLKAQRGLIDQLAVGRMIGRLQAAQRALELRQVFVDVACQLALGDSRPGEQPFLDAVQRLGNLLEVPVIEMRMSSADDAGFVVNLAEWVVRPDALLLDVIGRKPEDVSLSRIHPDNGVGMGHEPPRMLRLQQRPPEASGP